MKVRVKVSYQETICKEVSFVKDIDKIESLNLQDMVLNYLDLDGTTEENEYRILEECENGAMDEECNKDKFYERSITGFEIEEVTE